MSDVLVEAKPIEIIVATTGLKGDRGLPGISSEGVKIPFSWGDASPVQITQVQGIVYRASIIIVVPFNGSSSTLKIGDAQQGDRLMAINQSDPSIAAEYTTCPQVRYSTATNIFFSDRAGNWGHARLRFLFIRGG